MTRDEFKKLNRAELLELLLDQVNVSEKLKQELQEANEKLESREISIQNAGSIAEAALSINEVFAGADAAAKQYLDSARQQADRMLKDAAERSDKMVTEAEAKAKQMVSEAEAEAEKQRQEAEAYWTAISNRMEQFYQDHAWLREILDAKVQNDAVEYRSKE